MPRKKSGTRKAAKKAARPAKKPARKKKAVKKKPARTAKKKSAAGKSAARKKAAKKKKATAKKKRPAAKKAKSLGRAKIPADAKLDVVFQKDYQAREVFEFLQVTTVRELEQHAPDEIVERMTRPLVQTIARIRKSLALFNRCLAGDEKFALEFLKDWQKGR